MRTCVPDVGSLCTRPFPTRRGGAQPVETAAGAIGADERETRAAIDEPRAADAVETKALTHWGDDASTAAAFLGRSDAGSEELARVEDQMQSLVPSRVEQRRHRVALLGLDRHMRVPHYVVCRRCNNVWPLFDEYKTSFARTSGNAAAHNAADTG